MLKIFSTFIVKFKRLKRTSSVVRAVVALLIFLVTFSAFIFSWNGAQSTVKNDEYTAFQHVSQAFSNNAVARLTLYQNILNSGSALISNTNSITQADWANYYQAFNIDNNYPEVEGITYSEYVPTSNLSSYISNLQSNSQSINIFPSSTTPSSVIVTYIAMYKTNTGASFGFNEYSDTTRRDALQAAILTGQVSMSGPVRLVGSTDNESALNIYYPVFQTGASIKTSSERQSAIQGYVGISVFIKSLIQNVLTQVNNSNFGLSFYDGGNSTPVFTSSNYQAISNTSGYVKSTIPFTLYNHSWRVVEVGSMNLVPVGERELPILILSRGLVISVALAAAVWYVISIRERRIGLSKFTEIQAAKDDLLSLASHQLRTPATIVKQYLGMLLQGYVGKVREEQREIIQSAYDSNEKQLEIISQLLYVARLDAGRITIRPELTNINQLIRRIAKNQSSLAKGRSQTINLILSRQPIRLAADAHYLTMALDNLLNNSIKYTPEKGKITISVKQIADEVILDVSDNGAGINPEELEHIFEKFTRGTNPLSTNVNGSGLGLYLTKQIIDLHGGSIEVNSEVGKGTIFEIHLPTKGKLTKGRSKV